MSHLNDLTGRKFSRLLVIERASDYVQPNGRKRTNWKCICDCQSNNNDPQYTYVTSDRLLSGNTKSCGCIRQEYYDAKNKNKFILCGDYYEGYTNKGEVFYFDADKIDIVKQYCWVVNKEGYIIASQKNGIKKQIWLHRLVMGVSDIPYNKILVDHIHGEKTRNDNRSSNLRLVNNSQNGENVKIRSNNTTGVTGVSFDKNYNKYIAYICVNKENINLGRYEDFNEAVKIRKAAEDKYFGEYKYIGFNSNNINVTNQKNSDRPKRKLVF